MTTQIIKLHNQGYSYKEIADKFNTTRNSIAGKIWRWKNPGMYKKGVPQNSNRR